MTTVTQTAVEVKHAVTLPWAWGFSDGFQGESWAEGYGLFAGERLRQYLAGHAEGRKVATHKALMTAQVAPASDPVLAVWAADGCPTGGFTWEGDFLDVLPADQRDDYVGM